MLVKLCPLFLGLLSLAFFFPAFAALPQRTEVVSSRSGCSCIETFEKDKLQLQSKWLDHYREATKKGSNREKSRSTAISGLRKDLLALKSECKFDVDLEVCLLTMISPFLHLLLTSLSGRHSRIRWRHDRRRPRCKKEPLLPCFIPFQLIGAIPITIAQQTTIPRENIQIKIMDVLKKFGPQLILFGLNVIQTEMVILRFFTCVLRWRLA